MAPQDLKNYLDPIWLPNELLSNLRSEIAFTDKKSPEEVISFVLKNQKRHLVQESNLFLKDEINAAAQMIYAPKKFLEFPLMTLFHSEGSTENELRQFQFPFNSNGQKFDLLKKFEKFFNGISDSLAVLHDASLIIDELFTNAMYNAPFNNLENTASGKKRDESEFEMEDGRSGKIFASVHANRMVIGCEDPYGTLNVKKILQRIQSCLVLGADKMISFEKGGAGIGSYLLFMSSVSLYIGVQKHHKTVICSALPIGIGDLKRNEMPKSLHFFELPEAEID